MPIHTRQTEIKVRQRHTYEWTCPVCDESNHIELSVQPKYLSCPICGIKYGRDGVTSNTWTLPVHRRVEDLEPVELAFRRAS